MSDYYQKYLKYKKKYLELVELKNKNLDSKTIKIGLKPSDLTETEVSINFDLSNKNQSGGNILNFTSSSDSDMIGGANESSEIETSSDSDMIGGANESSEIETSSDSDMIGGYDSNVTISSISEFDSSISIEDFQL